MTAGPEEIAEAVRRLKAGRLVAFPTETVYGLGAAAFDAAAVARVFAAKGRPANNPLIVHVTGAAMARTVTAAWPTGADRLAARFWPGPLTLVLPKRAAVPEVVTAGASTVAVRVPDHPLTLALIEMLGEPIVGPSANPSGYVSPTRAEHVRSHFTEADVYVLDGGPCRAGIESTVVDLTTEPPTVLRAGVIGASALASVVGRVDETPRDAGHATARSPGLVGPHYQPRARVVIAATLREIGDALAAAQGPAVVIGPPGTPVATEPPHAAIPMPAAATAYAAELYAALREADDVGASLVVVADPAPPGTSDPVWLAVMERLRRAAAG